MKKQLSAILCVITALTACEGMDSQQVTMLAIETASIFTYTDQQAALEAAKFMPQQDQKNKVAPASNRYAQRLARLTDRHRTELGKKFNYKVYLSQEVNAFAASNGDVRVYQGLMELLTDDELRFVLGHEISHVHLGHVKKKQWLARSTNLALKGLSTIEQTRGIASGIWGQLGATFVNSRFSQYEELQADKVAISFMKRNGYNTNAAIGALQKLASKGKTGGFLSSHPNPEKRVKQIRPLL